MGAAPKPPFLCRLSWPSHTMGLMYKLALFTLCLTVMALGGGATGLGLVLGVLGFALGALALWMDALKVLTR